MNVNIATYMRASTNDQTDQHQRDSIHEWVESEGYSFDEVDEYADIGSGATSDRKEFQKIKSLIEADEYDYLVVWEISRISRDGETLQNFLNLCENTGTTIIVTDGAVQRITPQGEGRFIADIIGMVYQQERRTLIRRTKSGVKRARESGKWVGNPPAGFVVVDGFLKPNLDPDYSDGETGYFDIVEALESIESGQSYNKTAEKTPNVTRQTLSKIDNNSGRRAWYLAGEAEDDRVQEAIDAISTQS